MSEPIGEAFAHVAAGHSVLFGLQQHRVLPKQVLACKTAELYVRLIDGDQTELRILKTGGKG